VLCPCTLLVTGGRTATLEFYGQGATTVGPDTLTHTLYHKGIMSTGGPSALTGALSNSHAAGTHVVSCPLCLEGLRSDVIHAPAGYTTGVQELLRRSDALMLVWDLATISADLASSGAAALPKKQRVEACLVCPAGEGSTIPPPLTLGRTHISVRVI
jgi:hypothetical protein